MSDALWQRFEGFLGKIATRQREIFAEAEEGIAEIIGAFPEDPMPLTNALQGLRFRVDELRQKVEDTWEKQIGPMFEDTGSAFHDRGLDRKQDFLQALSEEWDLFSARMSGDFYRSLAPRVQVSAQKPVYCGTCGADLHLTTRKDTVTVKCGHCHAVNQIMPDGVVSLFQAAGHAFAEEAALPIRHKIDRWRIQVDRERRARDWAPESVDSLDKWLELERSFWDKYVSVKAQTLSEPPDLALRDSRLQSFIDLNLKTDQRWRRAKGA